jgi:branched-chain amino acid aminotransferase
VSDATHDAPLAASTALPALWVNGARAAPDAPAVAASDRGLLLADGVFETMRAYSTAHGAFVFRLDAHLARLAAALDALGIPHPERALGLPLAAHVRDALAASGARTCAVRLTVTRGVGQGLLPPTPAVPPTVLLALQPLPVVPPRVHADGLAARVATGRRNERAPTAGLKTLAYTDAVATLLEARRAGADEALLLDTRDRCSEASASNLFAVVGDALLTPSRDCGILPGITRDVVLERARALAPSLGLAAVEERPFGLDVLATAREAFLTSSLRELAPLVRVDGRPIGDGRPGPVTQALVAAFRACVAAEGAAAERAAADASR